MFTLNYSRTLLLLSILLLGAITPSLAAPSRICIKEATGTLSTKRKCKSSKGFTELTSAKIAELAATSMGPAGATGPQGDKGDTGTQGVQGAQGAQGVEGPQGASPFMLSGDDAFFQTGNVGIGTANPSKELSIESSDLATSIEINNTASNSNSNIRFEDSGSGVAEIWFDESANKFNIKAIPDSSKLRLMGRDNIGVTVIETGEVGVKTESPAFDLHVNGSAGKPGGGSWSVASDIRLKKNIVPLETSLDKLLALRGVNFEYRAPKEISELSGVQSGFIAQEVEEIFPEWVEEGPDGYKRLSIRGFEALTVEAVRDLRLEKDVEIAALRKEIQELKQLVQNLK